MLVASQALRRREKTVRATDPRAAIVRWRQEQAVHDTLPTDTASRTIGHLDREPAQTAGIDCKREDSTIASLTLDQPSDAECWQPDAAAACQLHLDPPRVSDGNAGARLIGRSTNKRNRHWRKAQPRVVVRASNKAMPRNKSIARAN